MYAIGAPAKYIMKGDNKSAIIEPTETYFVVYVITAHIAAIISPTAQFRANIVPTPDATDFPPLNCKKMDLLCPTITATDAATGAKPYFAPAVINNFAKITGRAPLNASRRSTIKNHFFPSTLLTFVAPVEPEPIVLISSPVLAFTIKYPVDIEPIKYAATTVRNNSKILNIMINNLPPPLKLYYTSNINSVVIVNSFK